MTGSFAENVRQAFRQAMRFKELERRVQTFEQPDGTYRHWLLLSIQSTSPGPSEAIDELVAKRKQKGGS